MSLIYESTPDVELIDARGPRFSALLTTIVLGTALATGNPWLIVLQAIVFAIGAFKGPQHTPYAQVFKKLVKPKLKSEATTEDVRPPKFAQRVGFGFTIVAIIGLLFAPALATVAVSFALAAAFLNAAFNFCLGCEIYLRIARLRAR
ncbi:MAG: DUF4395 domain-containing protein [Candidatus Nanopelagicaceae bacterium]|jgi:hypothetical protein|nr:DUF4395 domain-containing protein [Candidatus Nanopelagicaceae bacterium]